MTDRESYKYLTITVINVNIVQRMNESKVPIKTDSSLADVLTAFRQAVVTL